MTLDLARFWACRRPCSKGTLWQRFLDWVDPRYTVGVDEADGKRTTCRVLMRRSGCLEVVKVITERTR